MTFTGNPNVLDPPGAVNKALVKGQFLSPTANDINRIDELLAMTGTAWAHGEITTLAKALISFGGTTKPITLADIASLIVAADTSAPFVQANEIGMIGDGVTDDSFTLQTDMEQRTGTGGAVYFLRAATPGASFYLEHTPRVPSNITLLMASPFLLAKGASFTVQGSTAVADGVSQLRLAANVPIGAVNLPVDTSPQGGGTVSSLLSPNDTILIIGNRDGCGTPRLFQELRVTSVNDGTAQVVVSTPLQAAYSVIWPAGAFETNYGTQDQSLIIKLAVAHATADLAAGSNLVHLLPTELARVPSGAMVLLKDDVTVAQISGAPGGSTAPCNEELAMIVPSVAGDPANTVRLDRRTSRSFFTAYNFRLMRILPATNVTISGARFLSAASPDPAPTRVHWSEQSYARGVVFDGCTVPNSDVFGKRGDAFRAYRTLEPIYLNCSAARARFVGAGEGNGIVFDRSTGGRAHGGLFDAMRHATQCVSGNGHAFHDVSIVNPRHAPVDCHGTMEIDCHWHDCTLSAGTQYQASEGRSPAAITFGNPSFLAGPWACGFHGGSITGFKSDGGSLEAVIHLFPGSRDCVVDTVCNDIGQLFEHQDLPGLNVISSGHRIRAQVNGCASRRLVDIQSRANGASIDTLSNVRIEVYGRNLNGCFYIINATELEIYNCDIDETIFDGSAPYFVEAAGCTNLRIIDNKLANVDRFVRMSGCTGYRVVNNRSLDQINTTMFNDAGGNSGIWVDNREVGFLGAYTSSTTSSLTFDGRMPGHWDLPDDSVLRMLPIQPKGMGQFYAFSGTSFFARFFYDTVTSFIDLDAVTTSNVDGVIVPLTGTTGVDGRITIAVVNADNSIQIENRSGSTARICGRVD